MTNDNGLADLDTRPQMAVPPIQAQGPPAAAQAPAQQPAGGGGPLGGMMNSVMAGLQNSLAQAANQVPAGAQVQQRHGGLLTGLAGVLLDGLASGMAPNAAMAFQMPMIRQQQAMQQQQMQLQQQKMQEEMRQAPMREAMQWAQTLVTMQGLRHAMASESADNQLHINDLQDSVLRKAQQEDRLTVLGTGSVDEVMAGLETARQQDPENAMNILPWYQEMDDQGHVTKAAIVRIDPDSLVKKDAHHETTFTVDGKPHTITWDSKAGTSTKGDLSVGVQGVAKGIQDALAVTRPETPQQGLAAATQKAISEGRDPNTDPVVQQWKDQITDIQKAGGGGFEGAAYQQEVQRRQQAGLPPISMEEFHKKWPQTQIALAGLGIRQAGEARQEAAANYQAYDKSGKAVAGSMADLKAAGFPESKIVKQTSIQQQQTDASRDLIAPDGLFAIARRQMAELEKPQPPLFPNGKLGPVASRWNNFWARQGLDGDQQAFRNTLDMLGSRLMAAHLQRTNVSALEHFAKMIPENSTPAALKKELNEEYIYVRGQAKLIGGAAGAQ